LFNRRISLSAGHVALRRILLQGVPMDFNITTAEGGAIFYDESWFYVVIALAITVVFQLLCFLVAATCKFDLLTDFAGSTNFMALALISLCVRGVFSTRQIVLTAIVVAIRLELALFLLVRVCVRKKDDRFDSTRDNCCKFLAFWIGQMMWVWVCMLPVVFVNSQSVDPPLNAADYVAWGVMILGFIFQMAADVHKYLFKENKANGDKVCDEGLWAMSRHPNYFGEMAIWWGAVVAGIPLFLEPGNAAWWATVVSPLFTMLILLGGSGIPTSEGKNLARFYKNPAKRAVYERYHRRTPPVVPCCCPALYERLPMCLKSTFCCEFPCYQYREVLADANTSVEAGKMGSSKCLLGDDKVSAVHIATAETAESKLR
jgi:steroid 5-alpha reductase family enzyme